MNSSALKKYLIPFLVVVLLGILALGYALGYRPGPGLSVVRVGTLIVTNLPENSTLYVDQVNKGQTGTSGFKRLQLVPGTHSVIVEAAHDYPWNELVTITSSKDTSIQPVLVPTEPTQSPILPADQFLAQSVLAGDWFPTASSSLKLNCMSIYVEDNRVLARAATTSAPVASASTTKAAPACTPPPFLCVGGSCNNPTVVFAPRDTVHAIIPYPGRSDTLLISFGTSLIALEIDPRNPQFFAPILHGTSPYRIAPSNSSRVLLSAGGKVVYLSFTTATSTSK